MQVIKRNGKIEAVSFDKIQKRLAALCNDGGINRKYVDPDTLAFKVIKSMKDGMKTSELDTLAAEQAASQITVHPDFDTLAARIMISNLHKSTKECGEFSQVIEKLWNTINQNTGKKTPMIDEKYYHIIQKNADRLNSAIVYDRDYLYSYFGIKTLECSYLLKIDEEVVERPQHMLMRVAIGIHGKDIDAAIETYDLLSRHIFTHASPTMFNAATVIPQLSSCFVQGLQEDSIVGIYQTMQDTAIISKTGGGVGIHIHDLRGKGSPISTSNGKATGVMPFLKLYNGTALYVNQSGSKRKGAIAIYLELWHCDILDIVECRKNSGNEDMRSRDLFPGLWIPDLFMQRVINDLDWSLMSPDKCPGLSDVYGEEFNILYEKYEKEKRAVKTVKARDLWRKIVAAKIETGTPYICFKDAVNLKTNHKNLGTIKCSNLCTEIMQYSDAKETAVCNLASIALSKFIRISPPPSQNLYFDFEELKRITRVVVKNLNKIIDVNFYPTEKAKISNLKTRPIGIGVQGLADTFIILRMPFASQEAKKLNRQIFEAIYYAALEASCELAKQEGVYEEYNGSPVSQGELQFDMWEKHGSEILVKSYMEKESIQNWDELREKIKYHGVRNSLLVAPMPTASTAQILGNAESFEPYTSNIFSRNVLSGSFQVVNKFLIRDLLKLNLWNEVIKNQIITDGGSIQNCHNIPPKIKDLYKTAWEISQEDIIDMSADRGIFIDQSQSLNLYIAQPTFKNINAMLMYAWKKNLKTGSYYLRTKPAAKAVQFTVDKTKLKQERQTTCSLENKNNCIMCSS